MEHAEVYVDESSAHRTAGQRKAAVHLGLAAFLVAASLVAVRAAGSPARALSTRGADKTANVVPQSTGCAVTFTNPGPPAVTACVSSHGNVDSLIWGPFTGGFEHANHEGYCLRDMGTAATYYDRGTTEAGWGAATQSSTATTTTVTRTTTDGIYTLTQNIFFKYGSRMVLVGNVLKNNTAASRSVRFNRYADLDIDGSADHDVFDAAGGSVFAQQNNGVALTSLGNPSLVQNFGAETFSSWAGGGLSVCAHTFQPATSPTAPGDYVAIMQHAKVLAPGESVNFRVGYRLL